MRVTNQRAGIWRLSLEQIVATVAEHLGPGRVPGNRPGPCFSRQISMYLAKHVAGWSTTRIGHFYNGRHHTTVLHAITKVEHLRKADESIEALLEVITAELNPAVGRHEIGFQTKEKVALIDAIATRVLERVRELVQRFT
jgi:hypothetical protein